MYSPLPKQVKIKKSPIHGDGLFAKELIPKGTRLGISHIETDIPLWDSFPYGWIRTPLGGFYNHSETPNCELANKKLGKSQVKILKAVTDIEEGDELTCKYTLWKKEDMAQLTSISKENWLGL